MKNEIREKFDTLEYKYIDNVLKNEFDENVEDDKDVNSDDE